MHQVQGPAFGGQKKKKKNELLIADGFTRPAIKEPSQVIGVPSTMIPPPSKSTRGSILG